MDAIPAWVYPWGVVPMEMPVQNPVVENETQTGVVGNDATTQTRVRRVFDICNLAPLFEEPTGWVQGPQIPVDDILPSLRTLFQEPRSWRRAGRTPKEQNIPQRDLEEFFSPEMFREPRYWRRSLRLAKPFKGAKTVIKRAWRAIRRLTRRRKRRTPNIVPEENTIVEKPEQSCEIEGNPHFRRNHRCFAQKITHSDLFWHLKMHAYFLPRNENLVQALRQRAIRFLEGCKEHSMKVHSKTVAYVVTQAIMEMPFEKKLKEHQQRYFPVRPIAGSPLFA